jgi:hypothetical protein
VDTIFDIYRNRKDPELWIVVAERAALPQICQSADWTYEGSSPVAPDIESNVARHKYYSVRRPHAVFDKGAVFGASIVDRSA